MTTTELNTIDFNAHSRSQLLEMQHEMALTAIDLGMVGSDVTPRKQFRNREDALTTCQRLWDAIIVARNKNSLDNRDKSVHASRISSLSCT